jgi:hypothetical protein
VSEEVLAAIWRRRVGWSRAADRLKRRVTYARAAALVLSSLGAVLGTVAATLPTDEPRWRTTCAALSAVLLAVATFVTARFLTVDAVRAWTRARSVSEAIKAEVYAFRAGAGPYGDADPAKTLQRKASEVEDAARDLERHIAGITVGAATPPPPLPPAEYVKQRVEDQVEKYYRAKARLYAGRLAVLRGLELVLGLAATVLAALAAFIGGSGEPQPPGGPGGAATSVAAWVAVLTTLGAALAAHIAAGRYDFLVMSYYATARQLEDLVNTWRSDGAPTDPAAWSAFVRACEDAISVENESWLAKWAEQQPVK